MVRGAFAALLAAAFFCSAQQPSAPVWSIDQAGRDSGFRLEIERESDVPCAVILPPAKPVSAKISGSMEQTLPAAAYRGKTVRFSAWIRIYSTGLLDSGQLWMRVNRPAQAAQAIGMFDNLSDAPVNVAEWVRSEVTLNVGADAETISVGVTDSGAGTVWVKEISLLVIERSDAAISAREPINLKFTDGGSGTAPTGWRILPDRETTATPYKAEVASKGCHFGGTCASVESPNSIPPKTYGTMLQTFAAANYRGKTVRLRASLRLQRAGKEDYARLWLRAARAGESLDTSNLFEHLDYREIRPGDWAGIDLVRKIDDDVEEIGIGVMLTGKGKVLVDELSFAVLPQKTGDKTVPPTVISLGKPGLPEAPPASPLASIPLESNRPALSVTLPENTWPTRSRPSIEDQHVIINSASSHAFTYIRSLPNFLCNMLIDRSENRYERGWIGRDVLSLQLGFVDQRERYKLSTINGRPTSANYRSVGGAISEGDFGGVMAQIFWPHSAQFQWDHWTVLRGHTVHVFRYEVEQRRSSYELQFGGVKGRPVSTLSAHHGYVFIEDKTSYVLRIEQIADPPAGFPLRSAGTVIDYDWNDVGGQKYLLPLSEEITMGSASLRSLNVVQFRDYRKFGADSQITFDKADQPND